MAIAFACYVRARWGRLLGERTGELVAKRAARARSWPEGHLGPTAVAVAVMAMAAALVFGYWAAGGSFGLPGLQPHPSTGMQASRAAGGVVTVVGLLGLVGKWGHQARLWVPAALTWLGSGALVAFDGLMTVLNKLFVIFGAAGSTSAWSPLDTALVVKLVVGVLAAAVEPSRSRPPPRTPEHRGRTWQERLSQPCSRSWACPPPGVRHPVAVGELCRPSRQSSRVRDDHSPIRGGPASTVLV